MQQGHEVGMLARQLFPGGVEVRSDRWSGQAIRATRELVANPEVPAIFEGVFEHRRRNRRDRYPATPEGKPLASGRSKVHSRFERAPLGRRGDPKYRVVLVPGWTLASVWLAHVNRAYVFAGGNS